MMAAKNTPGVLWDDGLEYYSAVRCHTVNSIHETHGEVPQTVITGESADISWLVEFGWYDYVWYMSPEDTAMERKKLGRYCGPFFNEGDAMSAKILTDRAQSLKRTSVFRVSAEEARSEEFKKLAADFEASLRDRLKEGYKPLDEDDPDTPWQWTGVDGVPWEPTPTYEPYEPIDPKEQALPEIDEADEMQHEAYDRYITARVCVP